MSHNDNGKRILEVGTLLPQELYAVKCDNYVKRKGKTYQCPYLLDYVFGTEGITFDKVEVSNIKKVLLSLLNLVDVKEEGGISDEKIIEWCKTNGLPELKYLYSPQKKIMMATDEIVDEKYIMKVACERDFEGFMDKQSAWQFESNYYRRIGDTKTHDAYEHFIKDRRVEMMDKHISLTGGCPGFSINHFKHCVEELHQIFHLIKPLIFEYNSLGKWIPKEMAYKAYDIRHSRRRINSNRSGAREEQVKQILKHAAEKVAHRERIAKKTVLAEKDLVDLKKTIADKINESMHAKVKLYYNEAIGQYVYKIIAGSYLDVAYMQLAQLLSYSPTDLMLHLKLCATEGCGTIFWAKHGNRMYCEDCDPKKRHRYAQKEYRERIKAKREKEFFKEESEKRKE